MKRFNFVRAIFVSVILFQLGVLSSQLRGAPGDVDLSFDAGSQVDGWVFAVAMQPDEKVIIGGAFNMVRGLQRSSIARLNTDGTGDSSFNLTAGIFEYVNFVRVQPDGKLLVGGSISLGTGTHGYRIAHLNGNGSLDRSFTVDASSDFGIVPQPDGKLLLGGYFTTINGADQHGIARLNADGSLDSSFNPGSGTDGAVRGFSLQTDGKVLIGGDFTKVNGIVRNKIARLNANGSVDSGFNPGTGPSVGGYLNEVVQDANGKVLVGGAFTAFSGTNWNSMARLNANGTLDASFNPGIGADVTINSILPKSDGKLLVTGSVAGTNRSRIAQLNVDGSLDASFSSSPGVDTRVNSLVVRADGKVMIAGDFLSVDGVLRSRSARLHSNGSLDLTFNPGSATVVESPVSSLVLQPDGKVLIGTTRLNADGSGDSTYVYLPNTNFNPNIGVPGADYSGAECSAVQPDGKVLIGGYTASTIEVDEFGNHYYSFGCFVTRFNADGSPDTNFNLVTGGSSQGWNYRDPWSPTVRTLVVQPDGKILVGGFFGTLGGTNRNGMARLHANGTVDSSFNPGVGGSVYSMLLQPDGRMLVGSSAGVAWLSSNGTREPGFNPTINISFFHPVVVVLQPDGRVLVGGSFSTINGVSRKNIARLNSNGSLDTSFDPGAGSDAAVRAIALQPDGNVLIAGDFLTINGVVRPYVARLYGTSITLPSMNIVRSNAFVIVSWPTNATGYSLWQSTNLSSVESWTLVSQPVTTKSGQNSVMVPASAGTRFFRLTSP